MARDLHQISQDDTEEPPEPPRLRTLRRLVTLLTATMIVAMLVIAAAVVYQITRPSGGSLTPPIAGEIAIPEGFTILSVSRTGDRLLMVLEDTKGGRLIEERAVGDKRLLGQYRLVPVKPE